MNTLRIIPCLIVALMVAVSFGVLSNVRAQTVCPQGMVCYTPDQNSQILKAINEAIASKDVIAKMLSERGASDAALQSANQLIEGLKNLDVINGQIIAKQKDVMALYENTLKLQAELIDKLMLKINAPKSAWQKFISAVRDIAILAAGLSIGRL
jgi:hypothetical protein